MPLDVRSWNFLGIVISRAKAFIASWLSDQANEYQVILGYGVIGNTTVSGSVILGSSPGIPALKIRVNTPENRNFHFAEAIWSGAESMKYSFSLIAGNGDKKCKAPSYSGLVRRPLTAVTRVRIPLGSPENESLTFGWGFRRIRMVLGSRAPAVPVEAYRPERVDGVGRVRPGRPIRNVTRAPR